MNLVRGQKLKWAALTDARQLTAAVTLTAPAELVFDISCFGLDAAGRCTDERYFIFYNQHSSPCGGIRYGATGVNGRETFAINLVALPAKIKKLVFTVSIDGAGAMSQIQHGCLELKAGQKTLLRFDFQAADFKDEKAVMIGEFYFKDEWRFSAVGQGFNGGLSALLAYFGIEEQTDVPAPATPTTSAAPVSKQLGYFRELLSTSLAEQGLTDAVIARLEQHCREQALDLRDALRRSGRQVENFLRRLLADITADGVVTADEEATLERACRFLLPPPALRADIDSVIERFKIIGNIRAGHVTPRVQAGLVTRADEIVWYDDPQALLLKEARQRTFRNTGTLYVTSERLVFKSRDYPTEILLRNILDLESRPTSFHVIGKNRSANSDFLVADGLLLGAYVEHAINRFHRKLDVKPPTKTRIIAQSVKQAVWIRDQGRCVECGAAEHLEFDHIIPYSKGGSNSENNLQLLCRRCNQKKADSL